jgi:hypothetical protein
MSRQEGIDEGELRCRVRRVERQDGAPEPAPVVGSCKVGEVAARLARARRVGQVVPERIRHDVRVADEVLMDPGFRHGGL